MPIKKLSELDLKALASAVDFIHHLWPGKTCTLFPVGRSVSDNNEKGTWTMTAI